jgi:N utilization substance protein A
MDIDLQALKQLERDKEIRMDVLLRALEDALLNAYDKTPGAHEGARVTIDTKTGKVSVLVPELDEEGNRVGEYDDTPEGFGRVAAATARQVIF